MRIIPNGLGWDIKKNACIKIEKIEKYGFYSSWSSLSLVNHKFSDCWYFFFSRSLWNFQKLSNKIRVTETWTRWLSSNSCWIISTVYFMALWFITHKISPILGTGTKNGILFIWLFVIKLCKNWASYSYFVLISVIRDLECRPLN